MRKIKTHLNRTVKRCIENTFYMQIAASYKKISDINLLKSMKINEVIKLSCEKVHVQEELDAIESAVSNKLLHNRTPLIQKINDLDHDIDEIEQLLANLEVEKQNIQYEILLLSNVKP